MDQVLLSESAPSSTPCKILKKKIRCIGSAIPIERKMIRIFIIMAILAVASAGPAAFAACVAAETAMCVPSMWWMGPAGATAVCTNMAIGSCWVSLPLPTP